MMFLMITSLAATCGLWAWHTSLRINQIAGVQAYQLSSAMALGGQSDLANGNLPQLQQLCNELLKSGTVLFAAYYDSTGKSIASAGRAGSSPSLQPSDIESLTRIEPGHASVGDFFRVTTPMLASKSGDGLAGYASVAVLAGAEQLQLERVIIFSAGIGCVMLLISLPIAYGLVWRIFKPIRRLEQATYDIAAGNTNINLNIDRPDAIGVLARAFLEMAATIGWQRQELQDANAELEAKVEQRTSQLQAANRRLSNEIAEKEDFLRAVSHDLNAPLRNISGMAAMVLMKHGKDLDQDVVHRLERIQKNVETETGLISELLELSRIKTRRQKMEMVELDALVRELEGMFENDLRSRQIALKIDTPLPVIHGERVRLRQVFQNLIDNAIKYMGEGPTREIHIGCTLRPTEAEFYVADTGMGIDPEDLDKVFYVFRRGKNAAGAGIAGKGVGLACVKSIIETYSGSISVQSRSGQGSTFTFTINGQYVPDAQRMAGSNEFVPTSPTDLTDEEFPAAGTALQEKMEA
jgi:signal transduction histidine kinase